MFIYLLSRLGAVNMMSPQHANIQREQLVSRLETSSGRLSFDIYVRIQFNAQLILTAHCITYMSKVSKMPAQLLGTSGTVYVPM